MLIKSFILEKSMFFVPQVPEKYRPGPSTNFGTYFVPGLSKPVTFSPNFGFGRKPDTWIGILSPPLATSDAPLGQRDGLFLPISHISPDALYSSPSLFVMTSLPSSCSPPSPCPPPTPAPCKLAARSIRKYFYRSWNITSTH